MTFKMDNNGDITLIQGDSGSFSVNNIPMDKNYKVYFAIQDEKRKPIGFELHVESHGYSSVTFEIPTSLTDLLKVPKNEDFKTYYYAIKLCDENTGFEDTVPLANKDIGDLNIITVYPKVAEGI